MRFLIAGDWHSDLHENEVARALAKLGHDITEFRWHRRFQAPASSGKLYALGLRAQEKYVLGPAVTALNREFVDLARTTRPDVVFVYRGTHIFPESIRAIRASLPACVVVGYNNDDPYGPGQPRYLWRHFRASLRECDLTLAYRHVNIEAFRREGARRVELLRSWYVPDRNFPAAPDAGTCSALGSDVVFIGHYEDDGRLGAFESIARAGIRLRLFGPGKYWDAPAGASPDLKHLVPVRLVWGSEYNDALACSRIALCFLSKLNRDTYTRRCFEIPAAGAFLLSEYTEDLASLFEEGAEAEFFRSQEEMLDKIRFYLAHPAARDRIAAAGLAKVRAAGHDVGSRMNTLLGWVHEIRQGRSS